MEATDPAAQLQILLRNCKDVRISSTGTIISCNDAPRTSYNSPTIPSKASMVFSDASNDVKTGNETKRTPLQSIANVERYRPYPALSLHSPVTPFARLLLPRSELALDNLDGQIVTNLSLMTTVLTISTFVGGMLAEVLYWREPVRIWADRNFIRSNFNKSLIASIPFSIALMALDIYKSLQPEPTTTQLLEEHIILRQKERNGQIEDIRNVFDNEEDYKQFINRPSIAFFHGQLFLLAGMPLGILIHKEWVSRVSKEPWKLFRYGEGPRNPKIGAFPAGLFAGCLTVTLSSMTYQRQWGGLGVRERLRQHRLETREARMADLVRIKEIQSARALRIKELERMDAGSRRQLYSDLLLKIQ